MHKKADIRCCPTSDYVAEVLALELNRLVNLLGLIISFSGSVLLAWIKYDFNAIPIALRHAKEGKFYSNPLDVHEQSIEVQQLADDKKKYEHNEKFSKWGLRLLMIGFLVQIIAIIASLLDP